MELKAYEHLSKVDSLHPGQAYISEVYDSFERSSLESCHVCLVYPPLYMTVSTLQQRGCRQRYNEVLLRETLLRLFRVLDFLHSVADVVYTGRLELSIRAIVDT